MAFDTRVRYPREEPLFLLGMIFSGLFWLALVVRIVGILYGLRLTSDRVMHHTVVHGQDGGL